MKRLVLVLSGLGCAGCQSADPLTAFGPYRVPATSTAQATPYYPPPAANSQAAESKSNARLSVSAEGPLAPASKFKMAAEPGDREPIRVVEGPAANTRTATATNRNSATGQSSAVPAPPVTATSK